MCGVSNSFCASGNLKISPCKSALAMGKALVTHSRIRKTIKAVTVVLFEASMMEEVTVSLTELAAVQILIPSTSSRSQAAFKRLYLPQNGGEKVISNIFSLVIPDSRVKRSTYLIFLYFLYSFVRGFTIIKSHFSFVLIL